jgi:hypothetical protein
VTGGDDLDASDGWAGPYNLTDPRDRARVRELWRRTFTVRANEIRQELLGDGHSEAAVADAMHRIGRMYDDAEATCVGSLAARGAWPRD